MRKGSGEMKEYTKEDIILIRYRLALATEEICGKINNVKNKINNLQLLSEYKNQLTKILELDNKLEQKR